MKKIMVGAVVLIAIGAAPAMAADLPARTYTKAPPMAPTVSSWTGCYVGGNIGYGWQRNSTTDVDPSNAGFFSDVGSDTGSGVVGGGQVGCDYQFVGNWVVGIQGMFDGAGVKGSHIDPFAYSSDTTESHSTKADWFGTLTARLGYAVAPDTLLYVKGGGAWVHETFTDVDPTAFGLFPAYSGGATSTRTGWTVGGGGEYKFNMNWSVFAEYNYIGLGRQTSGYSYNCGAGCGFPNPYLYSDKNNFQMVLVGLNYRFGGPVVAKY
jgi:outer membrane immunogenic protein